MIEITIVGTGDGGDPRAELSITRRLDGEVDEGTGIMVDTIYELIDNATNLLNMDSPEPKIIESFGGVLSYILSSVTCYLIDEDADREKEDIETMSKVLADATKITVDAFVERLKELSDRDT